MHHYWGFGLHISSEIEFPELYQVSFSEAPAITIKTGSAPKELAGGATMHRVNMSVSPTEYLLKVNGVATYYATNGNSILVEPVEGADMDSIRLFLLSNAISSILYQRNIIPLHASAVLHNKKLILFCGHSRAGKSTLVTKLKEKGFMVFSDDICALQLTNDQLSIHSSYPMTKLWEDSYDLLSIPRHQSNVRLRPQLAKYGNFFHDHFITDPCKAACIFIMYDSIETTEDISIKQLSFMHAFSSLLKISYRQLQLDGMGKREINFSTLSKLASSAPVYEVKRKRDGNTIDLLAEKITEILHEIHD